MWDKHADFKLLHYAVSIMDLQDYGDLIDMLVEEDKEDCNITF